MGDFGCVGDVIYVGDVDYGIDFLVVKEICCVIVYDVVDGRKEECDDVEDE